MSNQNPLFSLLTCPKCGNNEKFLEVADNVVTTTLFTQNNDGSFSAQESENQALGTPKLFCAVCEENLSSFHHRFSEMIF